MLVASFIARVRAVVAGVVAGLLTEPHVLTGRSPVALS